MANKRHAKKLNAKKLSEIERRETVFLLRLQKIDLKITQLQEEELEVIHAIFGSEFEIDDDHTDYDFPFAFRLRLTPNTGDALDSNVSVTFRFRFPREYPSDFLDWTILGSQGLSREFLMDLKHELPSEIRKSREKAHVYDIALYIQDYLYQNNKAPMSSSFHEEMVSHQKEMEKETKEIEFAKNLEQKHFEQQREEEFNKKVKERLLNMERMTLEMKAKDSSDGIRIPKPKKSHANPLFAIPLTQLEKSASAPSPTRMIAAQDTDVFRRRSIPNVMLNSGYASSERSVDSELLLNEFDPLHNPLQDFIASYQLENGISGVVDDSPDEIEDMFDLSHSSNRSNFKSGSASVRGSIPILSRYEQDFDEEEPLGKGGFGEVVKARNKLDGLIYAIKKIKIYGDLSQYSLRNKKTRILREVTTIARLQHQYIVRYYQAWIEGSYASDENELDEDSWEGNFSEGFSGLSNSDAEADGVEETSESTSHSETLYIQMEYCPKRTLRNVINDRISPDETWRLFRQIVESVAYIHSKGIIHRDIKCENIFISEQGNIKIGDFGLATGLSAKNSSMIFASNLSLDQMDSTASGDLTDGVGTPFYRAPEQETSEVRYDERVDCFSLGIIFFEMWFPFETLMERFAVLTELRKTGKVPETSTMEGLNVPDNAVQIIEWLLHEDPTSRPFAEELLDSGLIPLLDEELHFNLALKSLKNDSNVSGSQSSVLVRVLDTLFARIPDEVIDATYNQTQSTNFSISALLLEKKFVDIAESIFKLHGAIPFEPPLVTPKINALPLGLRETAPAVFLDNTANVVQLPQSLLVPFARFVKQNGITEFKRYCISRVYRQTLMGGHPQFTRKCDFDVIWTRKQDTIVSAQRATAIKAETLKVAMDVLQTLPFSDKRYRILLSHVTVFQAIIDSLVSECLENDKNRNLNSSSIQKEIVRLLLHFGTRFSWTQIRKSLQRDYFLSDSSIAALENFIKLPLKDSQEESMTRLKHALVRSKLWNAEIQAAIDEMQSLIECIKIIGVHFDVRSISGVGKLAVCHLGLFRRGLVFQVALEIPKKNRYPELINVATGGSYEHLISAFTSATVKSSGQCAFGVSIEVDRLMNHIALESTSNMNIFNIPSESTTSVLLLCKRGRMLKERLEIAAFLWKSGVRCEYDCHADEYDKIISFCTERGIEWIVLFNRKLYANGELVKVQNVSSKSVKEIAAKDLVYYVEMKDENKADKGSTQKVNYNDVDVNIILAKSGSAIKTHLKAKYIKATLSVVGPLVSALQEDSYFIFSIPVSINAIRLFFSAFHEGKGSIETLFSQCNHSDKELLGALQRKITEALDEAHLTVRYVFVYSILDKKCDLMSF